MRLLAAGARGRSRLRAGPGRRRRRRAGRVGPASRRLEGHRGGSAARSVARHARRRWLVHSLADPEEAGVVGPGSRTGVEPRAGPSDGAMVEVVVVLKGPQRTRLSPVRQRRWMGRRLPGAFFDSLAQFYCTAYLWWVDVIKRRPVSTVWSQVMLDRSFSELGPPHRTLTVWGQ